MHATVRASYHRVHSLHPVKLKRVDKSREMCTPRHVRAGLEEALPGKSGHGDIPTTVFTWSASGLEHILLRACNMTV
eukprot:757189-Hanusia_phi.AAC.4